MDEDDAPRWNPLGEIARRISPPERRWSGTRSLRHSLPECRKAIRGYGACHARGGNAEKLRQIPLTVARQFRDIASNTIVGGEGSIVGTALLDVGAPEISAQGLDHVEVVGPIVRWVYYTLRWMEGRWERHEAVIVTVPLADIEGGIGFLRERYHGKIHEAEFRPFNVTGLRAVATNT